MEDMVKL
jgi:hypothetical protein